MSNVNLQPLCFYYARCGYSRHLQTVCREGIKKRGKDPVLVFWLAFGLASEGANTEAIRELDSVASRRPCIVAGPLALVWAHKRCRLVDHEAVRKAEEMLTSQESGADEESLLLAATFLFLIGKNEKAVKTNDKVLEMNPGNPASSALRGWLELSSIRESLVNKSVKTFDDVLEKTQKKDLYALMGKAAFHFRMKQYKDAHDVYTHLMVIYPWFIPALGEIAKSQVALGDWDQAMDTCQRSLSHNPSDITCMLLVCIHTLALQGKGSLAAQKVGDLVAIIESSEPMNAQLHYSVAAALARLAGRHPGVLNVVAGLIERAMSMEPENSQTITECAYINFLLEDYQNADALYKQAVNLDSGNNVALLGSIRTLIVMGNLSEAASQLEFLSAIQMATGSTSEVEFLSALLAWKKDRDPLVHVEHLSQALDLHLKVIPTSFDGSLPGIIEANPEYMLTLVRELSEHWPVDPINGGEPQPPALSKASQLIDVIMQCSPGLLEARNFRARIDFLVGNMAAAKKGASSLVRDEPGFSECHLLMAQIQLHDQELVQAQSSLEMGLAHNFEVREWPLFNILRARTACQRGELEDAQKIIDALVALPSVSDPKGVPKSSSKAIAHITPSERAAVFLEQAHIYDRRSKYEEAIKVLQGALNSFRGTKDEASFTIALSEMAAKHGDVDHALAILRSVPKTASHFLRARLALGRLLLRERNDKKGFIRAHKDLCDVQENESTLTLLGQAYMQIQDPDGAIAAFQQALKLSPSNSNLSLQLGEALVSTHDFSRAIEYYRKAAAADNANLKLHIALAELYLKLQKIDLAKDVITRIQADGKATVEVLLLQSKIWDAAGDTAGAIEALKAARDSAKRENPGMDKVARADLVADIIFRLANYHLLKRQVDKAISYYTECLRQKDGRHTPALLALADIYRDRGDLEACASQTNQILKFDPNNEKAILIMADVMFHKNETEQATVLFQKLLEKNPRNSEALMTLLHLLKQVGRLGDAPRFLILAETALGNSAARSPGLSFCKGMHCFYANNPRDALKQFNMARRSHAWRVRASVAMIEVYLNLVEAEITDDDEKSNKNKDKSVLEAKLEIVKSADNLLRECGTAVEEPRRSVFVGRIQLAMGKCKVFEKKTDCEAALATFNGIILGNEIYRDYVPALLGGAQAFVSLKQIPKARNNLKRIVKMPYDQEHAESYEKSYLLLAELYIESNKYDLAQELCRKALTYNKSCARAWEFMGMIMEKEQSFKDAAENYEMAWKLSNQSLPSIGYKLAFNYLKAKRYVETIDVCQRILELYPTYPKIKKEILAKARAQLRV